MSRATGPSSSMISMARIFGGVGYRFDRVDAVPGYRPMAWRFDDSPVFDDRNRSGPSAGVKFLQGKRSARASQRRSARRRREQPGRDADQLDGVPAGACLCRRPGPWLPLQDHRNPRAGRHRPQCVGLRSEPDARGIRRGPGVGPAARSLAHGPGVAVGSAAMGCSRAEAGLGPLRSARARRRARSAPCLVAAVSRRRGCSRPCAPPVRCAPEPRPGARERALALFATSVSPAAACRPSTRTRSPPVSGHSWALRVARISYPLSVLPPAVPAPWVGVLKFVKFGC